MKNLSDEVNAWIDRADNDFDGFARFLAACLMPGTAAMLFLLVFIWIFGA